LFVLFFSCNFLMDYSLQEEVGSAKKTLEWAKNVVV